MKKNISVPSLILIFIFGLFLSSQTAIASNQSLTIQEETKVIEIIAGDIPQWLGKPIRDYSLMSISRNRMQPIPFQIDEMDELGRVYFSVSKVKLQGELNKVDAGDELLFLMKDTGDKINSQTRTRGESVAEIEVTTASGEKRYVYIVAHSRLKSDEAYVRYASIYGRVETDHYTLTHNANNALNWDDFQYNAFEGEQKSPFDRMKLEISSSLIVPFPRLVLRNKNIVAKPIAEHVGPIRATTQFTVTLKLFGLPMQRFQMQVHYKPADIEYYTLFKIPRFRRFFLQKPEVIMAIDANNMQGTQIITSNDPNLISIADGTIDINEFELLTNRASLDNNWQWVRTGQQLELFTTFKYEVEAEYPVSFHLKDELTGMSGSERFEGKGPEAGYKIHGIPRKGEFGLSLTLSMSPGYDADHGEDIYNHIVGQPKTRITSLQSETVATLSQ